MSVLVTGATFGFGLAIARRFARNGHLIADAVFRVATRPAHVNVNVIELMPVAQAFVALAVHRARENHR